MEACSENTIMFNELMRYAVKPQLYAQSNKMLWDDEHISKGMLEAHLNPNWEAATRKPEFLEKSVKWISQIAPPSQYERLLDLGCGPGLYAERFHKAGYSVTGLDISKRSIEYAKEQTAHNKSNIEYLCQDYLTINYSEQFDVITLIYGDYAVFSVVDRVVLLEKIYKALKPGGRFIFDVFTPKMRKAENHSWFYSENGGFYSPQPHICMEATYQYDDEDKTELDQYIVLSESGMKCYHVWNHYFTKEALISEVQPIGFSTFEIYGDVAGEKFSDSGETICGVFTK